MLMILFEIIFYWVSLGTCIIGCMWLGLRVAICCETLVDFFINKK